MNNGGCKERKYCKGAVDVMLPVGLSNRCGGAHIVGLVLGGNLTTHQQAARRKRVCMNIGLKESCIVTYCALCAFKMGGGRADVMSLVEAKRRLSAVPFATHLRWRERSEDTPCPRKMCMCDGDANELCAGVGLCMS